MPDGSSLGVTPGSNVSTGVYLGYNSIFASQSNAVSIGGLSQDQTELNVVSQLSIQAPTNFYSFNFESGDAIKLGFNAGGTGTQPAPRVQLVDAAGNVVADNYGTTDQQTAYTNLTSSNGLSASNGTYYVQVTTPPGSSATDAAQTYNFQLYSGTTYNTNIVTTALTQAYDPNLFISASDSITPPTNVQLYSRGINTGSGGSSAPVNVGQVTTNQTELDVVSQVTSASQTDTYNFTNTQSGPLKLTLNDTTGTALLDAQLVDSNGNVIADNNGTTAQKQAYLELTSGAGLQAAAGQYTLNVGYAAGQLTGSPQSYNLQINSGTGYSTIYQTSISKAATPSTTYSVGANLGVYSSSDAQLYSRSDYNQISATASSAVNIGWLKENTSSLAVNSQLTSADNTDYYSFTLQQGNSIQMAFANQTDSSAMHVQVLDSTGSQVIADNQGTAQQQAAFAQLTSDGGLSANPGQYLIKVSYGADADRSKTETYNFQLYSGSSYTSAYVTTASAQTIQNQLLSGGSLGYNAQTAAVSFLDNLSNGVQTDIFGNPSIFGSSTNFIV